MRAKLLVGFAIFLTACSATEQASTCPSSYPAGGCCVGTTVCEYEYPLACEPGCSGGSYQRVECINGQWQDTMHTAGAPSCECPAVDAGGDGPPAETGGASSGLPADRRLIDLTATEKGQMCDWITATHGGYGHTPVCGSGTPILSYPDRASCVADSPSSTSTPSCAATVSQMEACVNQVEPCLEAAGAAAVCAPLLAC
jgi:hypothetical protein